jgi:hypothetical protein
VLSPITWIPGVVLFLMQAGLAASPWLFDNWRIGLAVFCGFLFWIVVVSLVAMASSAYARWRVIAGGLVVGVFFVSAGAAALANLVLRVEWVWVLNPARDMYQVWRAMLGAEMLPGPGAWPCLAALVVFVTVLLAVLERKLRPVEVVG